LGIAPDGGLVGADDALDTVIDAAGIGGRRRRRRRGLRLAPRGFLPPRRLLVHLAPVDGMRGQQLGQGQVRARVVGLRGDRLLEGGGGLALLGLQLGGGRGFGALGQRRRRRRRCGQRRRLRLLGPAHALVVERVGVLDRATGRRPAAGGRRLPLAGR